MWDLPRPGLEPMYPALAGRFSTTVPPGKPPVNVFIWCKVRVQLHSFDCGHPVFPAPFVEKTVLCPLNCLGTLAASELGVNVKIFFWTVNSIPLICMSNLMPAPHCLDYCK